MTHEQIELLERELNCLSSKIARSQDCFVTITSEAEFEGISKALLAIGYKVLETPGVYYRVVPADTEK